MNSRIGLAPLLLLAACGEIAPTAPAADKRAAALARAEAARLKRDCGSQTGFDRLKSMTFTEAARIRRGESPALKRLASLSVVRMDKPVARARDAALGVTVCSGRFVLELPPGAQDVFDGDRRLEAYVEYAAQDAADGSGPVYQMKGAEPIIYRLAAVGLRRPEPALPVEPVATAAAATEPPAVLSSAAVRSPDGPPATALTPAPILVAAVAAPKPRPVAKVASRSDQTKILQRRPAARALAGAPEAKRGVRGRPPVLPVRLALRPVAARRSDGSKVKLHRPAPERVASRAAGRVVVARLRPTIVPAKARPAATKRRTPVLLAKASKPRAVPVKLAAARPRPVPVKLAVKRSPAARPVRVAAKAVPRAPRMAVAARAAAAAPLRAISRPAVGPVRVAAMRVASPPSFPCDDAGGRIERLICDDPWLARADRATTAALYRALDEADPYTRRELLRTRAAFLAYRDRCPGARCVAEAYADRIQEIRDIAADR